MPTITITVEYDDVDTIFLDPLAWRAVGKVEGWNGRDYFSNVYRNKQIQFIKDLQEGLSIKEALNNI